MHTTTNCSIEAAAVEQRCSILTDCTCESNHRGWVRLSALRLSPLMALMVSIGPLGTLPAVSASQYRPKIAYLHVIDERDSKVV